MVKEDELIPTRHSLLSRLKNWDDQESWKDFFDTYWKLIYGYAVRAGLSDAEAQDVVQETITGVAKNIHNFRCDPQAGSFKQWLLRLTHWRITDQIRKRRRADGAAYGLARVIARPSPAEEATGTSLIERIPDPQGYELEAIWDEEWRKNLLDVAVERLKLKVKAKHYQMFYLHVIKKLPAAEAARALGVSAAQVYLAKHRLSRILKKELASLEARATQAPAWLPGAVVGKPPAVQQPGVLYQLSDEIKEEE
jgi:RNA polymerase sigma factor (sigma-70 family)